MPSKPTYVQFSLVDQKVRDYDKKYWTGLLAAALDIYGNTKTVTKEDLESKAITCAALAGLGLALHNHFGTAVEELEYAEHSSCIVAGLAAVDRGRHHTDQMEAVAKKRVS